MDIYAEICSCQRIQCKEKKMNFKIQKYLINNIAEGIIENKPIHNNVVKGDYLLLNENHKCQLPFCSLLH